MLTHWRFNLVLSTLAFVAMLTHTVWTGNARGWPWIFFTLGCSALSLAAVRRSMTVRAR